jgi:anti-sigma factor RsiW
MTDPAGHVTEAEMHAYFDGELAPERQRTVEAYLAAHPEDADRLESYRGQDMLIRRAFRSLAERPLPARMVRALVAPEADPIRRWRWARAAIATAAAILLFVAGATSGWYGRTMLAPADPVVHTLLADAAAAHMTYTAEVRHAVEVAASEQDHLATWLGRRLDVPLQVPDLTGSGYELVGGRLLPSDQGRPAAQLMYQDVGGRRLTLYMRSAPTDERTAFRFSRVGKLSALYWEDGKVAWVLLGELPREQLLALAHEVYAALQG